MQSDLKISVVIPAYNRWQTLEMTLDRLGRQTLSPDFFEVVVVDDGSTDNVSTMVQSRIESSPYLLRYFWHENTGPGFTQNRGIREANSDLVLIMPGDILVTECMLEEHLKDHQAHLAENIAILGKVIQSPELPQTVFQRNWNPFRYDQIEGKRELDSIHFFGCNISLKKKFLLDHGLFLERVGAAHEDIEIGYRLGKSGLRILYNEKALAFHHHHETLESACRRAYLLGWNFDLLSENIPQSYIFPRYNMLSSEAGWKANIKILPREIVRGIIFNSLTVKYFWIPVLGRSEQNRLAACIANSFTFRGAVNYHMRAGYGDKRKGREYAGNATVSYSNKE